MNESTFVSMEIKGLTYAAIATLILIIVFALIRLFFRTLNQKSVLYLSENKLKLQFQQLELISPEIFRQIVVWLIHGIHALVVLALLYLYVPVLLRLFPWTEPLAQPFIGYFKLPMEEVWSTMVHYAPSLLHILIIILFTWLILKLFRALFVGIQQGYVVFPGFHEEWALPTYKILRFLVLALTLVMIFPLLPGAESPAFRGISLFIGAMVTIGSSSAMGNITAGIILIYTRSFRIGDYIKIGDTHGCVVERSLIATRLQTPKQEIVTIPNTTVMSSQVINYSDTSYMQELIIHATIGLGYDIDWRKVHELLIGAARKTSYVEIQPEPFVLQKSLDDFSVSYEINAYVKKPDCLPAIYSELYRNILDEFSRARIEIMSPQITALRNGNASIIPAAES